MTSSALPRPARLLLPLFLAAAACGVDSTQPGDPCADETDEVCRTGTVALYCRDGHWFERDCWVECRFLGYEVGYCGLHSRTDDETCQCRLGEDWTLGGACDHEGDRTCWGPQSVRACVDGAVVERACDQECGPGRIAACEYDAESRDDGCVCIHADPCDAEGEQECLSETVVRYCRDGSWLQRDCAVECAGQRYVDGECRLHSRIGDESCMCGPDEVWELGAACTHEGDQTCWGGQSLRACIDGRVAEVDCAAACAGRTAACTYDPGRGDDSCVCSE